jgi:hypothetical protein
MKFSNKSFITAEQTGKFWVPNELKVVESCIGGKCVELEVLS